MAENSKLILGPVAVRNFIDGRRDVEYGPTPADFPEGPFVAIATMNAPAGEEGEVEDFVVIGLNGEELDLAHFDDEFMSQFHGEVVMRGSEYVQGDTTHVIFRADEDGEVIAVFPFEAGSPRTMSCYSHVGQHSSCDIGWVAETREAAETEYASLKRELESAPYTYKLIVLPDLGALDMIEPGPAPLRI